MIVAHPPYIPDGANKLLFRDGGEDGEQIFRRIVQGLPQYLKPGGRFYCVTTATDRENESLQDRVRGWLGEKVMTLTCSWWPRKSASVQRQFWKRW